MLFFPSFFDITCTLRPLYYVRFATIIYNISFFHKINNYYYEFANSLFDDLLHSFYLSLSYYIHLSFSFLLIYIYYLTFKIIIELEAAKGDDNNKYYLIVVL